MPSDKKEDPVAKIPDGGIEPIPESDLADGKHLIASHVNSRIVKLIENVSAIPVALRGPALNHFKGDGQGNWTLEHEKTARSKKLSDGGNKTGELRKTAFHSVLLGKNFIELITNSTENDQTKPICQLHIIFKTANNGLSPFDSVSVSGPYGRTNTKSFSIVIPTYTDPTKDSGDLLPWLIDENIPGGQSEMDVKKLINTVVMELTVVVNSVGNVPDYKYEIEIELKPPDASTTRIPYSVLIKNTYYGVGGFLARTSGHSPQKNI